MKIALTLLSIIHGLIHFMGFSKAFNLGNRVQFTKEISKPVGLLWLLTGLLFMASASLILFKKDSWPLPAIIAVIISQTLIFTVWKDAKFGTIANAVLLTVAIITFATNHFENSFKKDVALAIEQSKVSTKIITEKDLKHLPAVVQKYLRYVGIVGKPKLENFKIIFEGEMRDKGKDWFQFTSEQFNFIENPTRLFFMKAKVKGIPTSGYHKYNNDGANMHVKLLSVFTVSDIKGKEMYVAETVTFFNDLCLFAPAALIDKRIVWETIDTTSAKATFTNMGITISAILYFNKTGQLIHFISNDRLAINKMKPFPFSTPVKNYNNINGYNLPKYGEAIWHYPDGDFVYGTFRLKSIVYNVTL